MSDLPILFSTPMVLALLAEKKTQTRRVLTPGPERLMCRSCGCSEREWKDDKCRCSKGDLQWTPCDLARYRVGDRLYVREEIRKWGNGYVRYAADGKETFIFWPERWKRDFAPGMHMPKTMSRLTLIVTGVRIQRLQEISEDDAIAEGITCENVILGSHGSTGVHVEITADRYWNGTEPNDFEGHKGAVDAYADLWDHLNDERDDGKYSWEANPWVATYTFSVLKKNIDRI